MYVYEKQGFPPSLAFQGVNIHDFHLLPYILSPLLTWFISIRWTSCITGYCERKAQSTLFRRPNRKCWLTLLIAEGNGAEPPAQSSVVHEAPGSLLRRRVPAEVFVDGCISVQEMLLIKQLFHEPDHDVVVRRRYDGGIPSEAGFPVLGRVGGPDVFPSHLRQSTFGIYHLLCKCK